MKKNKEVLRLVIALVLSWCLCYFIICNQKLPQSVLATLILVALVEWKSMASMFE